MVRSTLVLALLVIAACGSNGSSSGPCDVVPPDPTCSQQCDPQPGAPTTCPSGYYCNSGGTCFAQCTQGGNECGDGYTCTFDGHCRPGEPDPGTGSGSDMCPAVAFTAKPTIPSVLLLVDRSGSMREDFGGVSKWDAVRNALVDNTNGVVTTLASKAYFGAMLYDEVSGTACPRLATVPRALNNANAIRSALATQPDRNASTPTAKSIAAAAASFVANPPPAGSPPLIVLATDGIPYVCSQGQTDDRPGSVAAAAAAFAGGYKVIPLSVGNGVGDQHLQDVANAGAGVQAGQPNAPFYKANNPAALKAAFDAIIGGVVSCDLSVNGSVTQDQAAQAVVKLNGRTLVFNSEWQLIGDRTIRILGASCDELKSSAAPVVDGTFPCGVVIE
jgi:von Willebrand factor type A domain